MSLGAPDLHPRTAIPASSERIDRAAICAYLGTTLRQLVRRVGSAAHPPIAFVTVPAPIASLDRFISELGAFPDRARGVDLGDTRPMTHAPSVLWDPPSGPSFAGIGCAVEISAAGSDRIAEVARRAEAVWKRLVPMSFPGIDPAVARFLGGFSFVEGAAAAHPWQRYGDARFVLPTWLYTCDDTGARLSLALDMGSLDPDRERDQGREPSETAVTRAIVDRVGELERLLDHLAEDARLPEHRDGPGDGPGQADERAVVLSVQDTEKSAWRQQIEDIRTAIAERRCDKIVAARCRVLELSRDIKPAHVLHDLDQSYPDCYRFAYRFDGESVFVGATPERLITHAGERIYTQALAGSIAAGTGDDLRAAAEALLASSKDRSEQDFVVQTIRSVLDPLCADLSVPEAPEIRELRHVLHLETPISGTLSRPVHVLQLVAALHPTPAVGGVPTRMATEWIAEREPMPRGWYAAPVGWFDGAGKGEFAVAIRSGLLRGRTAYVYAGAGIVRDSDPDAEYAETRLKQRPITNALGIAT